jgi:hypothetical protein
MLLESALIVVLKLTSSVFMIELTSTKTQKHYVNIVTEDSVLTLLA